MNRAKITFANGYTLFLSDSSEVAPIIHMKDEKGSFASLGEYKPIYPHIHDGLIPSILDVLCFCDFFAVREKPDTIFCAKSIVSIESI